MKMAVNPALTMAVSLALTMVVTIVLTMFHASIVTADLMKSNKASVTVTSTESS